MTLPRYPASAPEQPRRRNGARHTATALMGLEAVLLGLSLPVQLFIFFSLGWEGGDEALKHRLIALLPLLGLGALGAAVLAATTAFSAHRDAAEVRVLAALTAGLTTLTGVGWLLGLGAAMLDPLWAGVWVVLTSPPVAALVLLGPRPRSGDGLGSRLDDPGQAAL